MTMPASVEQTTVDPVNGLYPTVTYDHQDKLITATVIVAWDAVEGDLVVHAPLIAIPKGGESLLWKVLWEVLPDATTLQSAGFDSTSAGVEIPAQNTEMPLGVSLRTLGPGLTPDQFQATIENGVASDSSLSYTLFLQGTRIGEIQPSFKKHDPTIVVTLDPMT
jgi:hypothetical protein